MKSDQVLEEYREGDEEKRLDLFLYRRGLRDAFEHMEQDDPKTSTVVRQESLPEEAGWFPRFLHRLRRRTC